jgi:peptidylprolyl isomerase
MYKIPSPSLLASSLLVVAASAASAQTAPVHHTTTTISHTTTTTHSAPAACSKLPEISPKVPALPAGLPCAKPLYTITVEPAVKLDYISPLEDQEALHKTLGIESTSFSLDYVDTHIGTGELARSDKFYTIRYTGYLTDGTKFDSSYDHTPAEPISIEYGQHHVIPGWDTGFDGMRIGGKRRLFIPYQLAYGANGRSPIPAKAELIFDVELVAQSDTDPTPKPPAPPAPKAPAANPAPSATPAPPATPPPPSAAPTPSPAPKPTQPQ